MHRQRSGIKLCTCGGQRQRYGRTEVRDTGMDIQRSGTNSHRYAHAEVRDKLTKVCTYRGLVQTHKSIHIQRSGTKIFKC